MLDTGLRRSEVAGPTLADTDWANQLVTVTGKGDKQRRVPYASPVKGLLADWLMVRAMIPARCSG